MDKLLWMHCFARAAETGSFSAVARELSIGQPNVSRHIASLEAHVGARLFHRSTRRLRLTSEGERYYEDVRRALDAIAEAEANARGEHGPRGLLRVACPTALSHFKLIPMLGSFLQRNPHIRLDLQIADRTAELIQEGIEVAVRVGDLRDSSLKARRIGTARRICVATPAYLAARGTPRRPADLARHDCVVYTLLATGRQWPFEGEPVDVDGRLHVSSAEAVRVAALNDMGIAMAPNWLFADDLARGTLVEILAEWPLAVLPIHALYAERRLLPSRASVFMDFLAEAFAADPQLCVATAAASDRKAGPRNPR